MGDAAVTTDVRREIARHFPTDRYEPGAPAVMGERMSRCSLSERDHPQRGEAMYASGSIRPVMGRASVALLFLPLAVHVVVGQLQVGPRPLPPQREIIVSRDRVDRLERWLKAVDQHEPGEIDDAASEIGRFSETALRDLWVDAQALVALMRDRKTSVFQATSGPPPLRTRIIYKPADLRRMRVLACAAAGLLDDRDCVAIDAKGALDGQAARLAEHAATSREAGDEDNYILRRAALLHADVAMLAPSAAAEPVSHMQRCGRLLPSPCASPRRTGSTVTYSSSVSTGTSDARYSTRCARQASQCPTQSAIGWSTTGIVPRRPG